MAVHGRGRRRGQHGLRRFGFRLFSLRRRGRRSGLFGGDFLAGVDHDGDRVVDLHALGAVGDEDLAENALVNRFDLHGGLVGFDFRDDIAGADRVASALSQRANVPSVMVGERAGIRMFVDI